MERDKIKRREVLRFLVGGGSAVMTDYMAYVFLLHMGIDMSVSKAVSYVCGAAVGFVINKYWTASFRRWRLRGTFYCMRHRHVSMPASISWSWRLSGYRCLRSCARQG